MVSVPAASGSGNVGTPCERMQAVNLMPAGPVPTCVDRLPPNPPPSGGNLRLVPTLPLVPEDVAARLATDDEFEPLPQPTARNARPVASSAAYGVIPPGFIP